MFRIVHEVDVGRKDRGFSSQSDGAQQEIDARACHARTTTEIVTPRCLFVIVEAQRLVVEGAKVFSQSFKRGIVSHSGEDFLPDRANQQHPPFLDQLRPGCHERTLGSQIRSYWGNFASSGNPNGEGLPVWSAYDATLDNAVKLDTPIDATFAIDATGCNFWDSGQ